MGVGEARGGMRLLGFTPEGEESLSAQEGERLGPFDEGFEMFVVAGRQLAVVVAIHERLEDCVDGGGEAK
jgi:hypothetical protein